MLHRPSVWLFSAVYCNCDEVDVHRFAVFCRYRIFSPGMYNFCVYSLCEASGSNYTRGIGKVSSTRVLPEYDFTPTQTSTFSWLKRCWQIHNLVFPWWQSQYSPTKKVMISKTKPSRASLGRIYNSKYMLYKSLYLHYSQEMMHPLLYYSRNRRCGRTKGPWRRQSWLQVDNFWWVGLPTST